MAGIQSVKREFCSNAVTVEKFIPNPQYPVDLKVSVSLNKIAHSVSSHEDAVMLSPHTPLSITKLNLTLFVTPKIYFVKILSLVKSPHSLLSVSHLRSHVLMISVHY